MKTVAPFDHPWVDLAIGSMEDAALVRPQNGSPLVFTVDFITPIVDRPEDFGAIAAANALSDVYAMGAEPQVALAVCGFPDDVPREVLTRILTGGRDKAAEAGCAIVGGHTVLDPELKYGLCVIGTVSPERVLPQTGARPGDRLVLTKPIGFGIAAQAIKQQKITDAQLRTVVSAMTTLNALSRDAAHAVGAHAATDVTGYGLLGHLRNLLAGSGCAARIVASDVPVYDFVRAFADAGIVTGGGRTNLEYVAATTRFGAGVTECDRLVLADPQTSGGLLLAVAADAADRLVAELEARGALAAAVIGEVVDGEPGVLDVLP